MKEHDLLEFLSSECSADKDTVLCVLASLGQTIEACFRDGEPVEVPGKEEAAIAYNEAAQKYHGEFAFLNNVPDSSQGQAQQ